jgi:hypothetical protein
VTFFLSSIDRKILLLAAEMVVESLRTELVHSDTPKKTDYKVQWTRCVWCKRPVIHVIALKGVNYWSHSHTGKVQCDLNATPEQ